MEQNYFTPVEILPNDETKGPFSHTKLVRDKARPIDLDSPSQQARITAASFDSEAPSAPKIGGSRESNAKKKIKSIPPLSTQLRNERIYRIDRQKSRKKGNPARNPNAVKRRAPVADPIEGSDGDANEQDGGEASWRT